MLHNTRVMSRSTLAPRCYITLFESRSTNTAGHGYERVLYTFPGMLLAMQLELILVGGSAIKT